MTESGDKPGGEGKELTATEYQRDKSVLLVMKSVLKGLTFADALSKECYRRGVVASEADFQRAFSNLEHRHKWIEKTGDTVVSPVGIKVRVFRLTEEGEARARPVS